MQEHGKRQWPSVKIFSIKYLKSQYPSKFPLPKFSTIQYHPVWVVVIQWEIFQRLTYNIFTSDTWDIILILWYNDYIAILAHIMQWLKYIFCNKVQSKADIKGRSRIFWERSQTSNETLNYGLVVELSRSRAHLIQGLIEYTHV